MRGLGEGFPSSHSSFFLLIPLPSWIAIVIAPKGNNSNVFSVTLCYQGFEGNRLIDKT